MQRRRFLTLTAMAVPVSAWADAGPRGLPLALTQMDWQLTDHRGQTTHPADWQGRPVMIFLGFSFCPDICPTTLMDITGWLQDLGGDADQLVTAFVTVDPERDSVQVLAEYLAHFDPRITGLTGELAQIQKATDSLRASFRKVALEGGDYTMDHSAGVYLFRADGRFAGTVDFHEDGKFAVPKIRRILP